MKRRPRGFALNTMLDAWAKKAIRRIGRRVDPHPVRRERKLLLVHLDGVPRAALDGALASGQMPFLARLLRQGSYRLDPAFWGSPASTPAFEAGALFGLRHSEIPAYRWRDRELERTVAMSAPADAHAIDQRLERRSGGSLLAGGGTAYLTLFRAGASNTLSMPALADRWAFARSLSAELRGVASVARRSAAEHLHRLASEVLHVGADGARWGLERRSFRHERSFFTNRLLLLRLLWGLAQSRAIIDMVRGVPAVYLVFPNVDEVGHRRGPESKQALRELIGVDAVLARLHAVSRALDEPYDLVFLSDHGQVACTPLERMRGRGLGPHLLAGGPPKLSAAVERALLDGRPPPAAQRPTAPPDPLVVESGNLAHLYLTRDGRHPLEAYELLRDHRELLARALASPEIGMVALRRGQGAVGVAGGAVFGPGEVEGAPLPSPYSRRAVQDALLELAQTSHSGDLVLYGGATAEGGTVSFGWEHGAHGGVSRAETDSFVLWPAAAPIDLGGLGHSTQLYQRLRGVYR